MIERFERERKALEDKLKQINNDNRYLASELCRHDEAQTICSLNDENEKLKNKVRFSGELPDS